MSGTVQKANRVGVTKGIDDEVTAVVTKFTKDIDGVEYEIKETTRTPYGFNVHRGYRVDYAGMGRPGIILTPKLAAYLKAGRKPKAKVIPTSTLIQLRKRIGGVAPAPPFPYSKHLDDLRTMTSEAFAERYGVSPHAAGAERRSRFGRKKGNYLDSPEAERIMACGDYTVKEMAKAIGCTTEAIYKAKERGKVVSIAPTPPRVKVAAPPAPRPGRKKRDADTAGEGEVVDVDGQAFRVREEVPTDLGFPLLKGREVVNGRERTHGVAGYILTPALAGAISDLGRQSDLAEWLSATTLANFRKRLGLTRPYKTKAMLARASKAV